MCDGDDDCCYWFYIVGSFFRGWLLLSFLVQKECLATQQIPVRGKHLDTLRTIDVYCIAFSKANTAPFTYFYLRYCYYHDTILWDGAWSSWLSVPNTIVPLLCLFLLFDLTYTAFHCTLHLSWIYPYIHKQHHIQKAPSRANVDAVNVHPIEFLGGEYNHLLVLYLYTSIFRGTVHILAAVLFLVLGGLLAGTNHTRYDVTLTIPIPRVRYWYGCGVQWLFSTPPYDHPPAAAATAAKSSHHSQLYQPNTSGGTNRWIVYWTIYDSKAHDVHHRIPQSNYGQYSMIWDYLIGTYRYVAWMYCKKRKTLPNIIIVVIVTTLVDFVLELETIRNNTDCFFFSVAKKMYDSFNEQTL
jgi:sterol desaturase/sphingolipid hydroxylase (fatty acid hydroxylase superfamily)